MTDTTELGAVFYTDGGCRPSRGVGGWGVHGYTYDTTHLAKPPKKLAAPSMQGYVNVVETVPVDPENENYTFAATLPGDEVEAVGFGKVQEYLDMWGTLIPESTNNLAEIHGLHEALLYAIAHNFVRVTIYMDSEYVRLAMLGRVEKWAALNWTKDDNTQYANREELTACFDLYVKLKEQAEVTLLHVDGHSEDPGNDLADLNATRGVNHGRNVLRGYSDAKTLSFYKETPAKTYGKDLPTIDRLIAFPRMYRLSNVNDGASSMFPSYNAYYLGNTVKELVEGKAVADRGRSVVLLKEPLPLVDEVSTALTYGGSSEVTMTRLLLEYVFRPNVASAEAKFLHKHKNNLLNANNEPVAEDLVVPHLAFRNMNEFSKLNLILKTFIERDEKSESEHILFTDVTDVFYEDNVVKEKTVTTLRKTITQNKPGISLSADIMMKGAKKKETMTYTQGISIPSRNSLAALESRKPKVYAVTTEFTSKSFCYYLIIAVEDGLSVWSSSPSNLKFVLGG